MPTGKTTLGVSSWSDDRVWAVEVELTTEKISVAHVTGPAAAEWSDEMCSEKIAQMREPRLDPELIKQERLIRPALFVAAGHSRILRDAILNDPGS